MDGYAAFNQERLNVRERIRKVTEDLAARAAESRE
jgi:hypothetical protein